MMYVLAVMVMPPGSRGPKEFPMQEVTVWAARNLTKCGPGKFDHVVDEVAYAYSLDGCMDEEISTEGGGGYVAAAFLTDLAAYAKSDADLWARLSPADVIYLQQKDGGFVLHECPQGFVTVTFWSSDAKARAHWEAIEKGVQS